MGGAGGSDRHVAVLQPSLSRPPGHSPPTKVRQEVLRVSTTSSQHLRATVHPSPPTLSLKTPHHFSPPASSPHKTQTPSSAPTPSRAPAVLIVWRTATCLSLPSPPPPPAPTPAPAPALAPAPAPRRAAPS